jgi:hypothetical protein
MITSYSIIKDNCAIVNGNVYLKGNQTKSFTNFAKKIYNKLEVQYSKFHKMDNLSKLGFLTSELLLSNKNMSKKYLDVEIGLVFSNHSSSLDTDKKFYSTIKNSEQYFPSPAVFVYTLPNIMMGEICIRNKFRGENAFFIMEEFDPKFIIQYSRNLIKAGKIKCCISGWVELDSDNYESVLFLLEKKAYTENTKIFELENIITQYKGEL